MQHCFYYKELLVFGSEHTFKYRFTYIQKNPRVAFPVRKTNNWRYSESHCDLRSQARQVDVIHGAHWALMRFLSIPCKGVRPTVYGRRVINPWFLVQQISCNKRHTIKLSNCTVEFPFSSKPANCYACGNYFQWGDCGLRWRHRPN